MQEAISHFVFHLSQSGTCRVWYFMAGVQYTEGRTD